MQNKQPGYLTPISVIGALVVCLALGAIFLFAITFAIPARTPVSSFTPEITLIAAPSRTPPLPTPLPGAPTFTPTPVPAGTMGIGAYVQISGTGGDGLRLRSGPGKDNSPLFLGGESEVFLVKEGPKQADGYTWWFLVAPYDDLRKGWAVENYLSVVSNAQITPTR